MGPVQSALGPSHSTLSANARNPRYQEIRSGIHQELLNRLNLERLGRVSREEAEPELRQLILTLLDREALTHPVRPPLAIAIFDWSRL